MPRALTLLSQAALCSQDTTAPRGLRRRRGLSPLWPAPQLSQGLYFLTHDSDKWPVRGYPRLFSGHSAPG